MELRKINYFFSAAELQNFTKAAQACHIAQTTMSKYIATLEDEVGCALFTRTNQRAELTVQGKLFYDGMKKLMGEYQSLCQSLHRDEGRELHIGMITSDYPDFPLLREFEREFSEISIYFSFGPEGKLTEDLMHGRLDALICPNVLTLEQWFSGEAKLNRMDIFSAEAVLICSREVMNRYKTVEGVISALPMITKTEEEAYPKECRRKLKALYGTEFGQVISVSGFPQQLLMINMSSGFAIVPRQTILSMSNLEVIPLPENFRESSQLLYLPNAVTSALDKMITFICHRADMIQEQTGYEKKC